MFGGLARFLDTKGKGSIYISAVAETCTFVRGRDSWNFYRMTPCAPTKRLWVFANGQTIQLTKVVVKEFLSAKAAGQERQLCRAKNHEESNEREVDQSKRNPLS